MLHSGRKLVWKSQEILPGRGGMINSLQRWPPPILSLLVFTRCSKHQDRNPFLLPVKSRFPVTYQQNENGTNSYEAWLLLLLLSCFSRVWLCVIPETTAHQAPPSWIFQARVLEWGAIAFSDEAWQLPLLSWNQPPLYKVLDQDYWIMRNNTERDSCEGELKYPVMWGTFLEPLILAQAAKRVSEWKTSTNANGV